MELGRGVGCEHMIEQRQGISHLAMFQQDFQEGITGDGVHLELAVEKRPVGVHGLLLLPLLEVGVHEGGVDHTIVDEAALAELVEELEGLVHVAELDEAVHEGVID